MMKRYLSVDIFRVIAAFLVVFIHAPLPGIAGEIILPITRIAVPFFFMTSGFFAYYPEKEKSIEKTKKHINKVLFLILTASVLYIVFNIAMGFVNGNGLVSGLSKMFTGKNVLDLLLFNNTNFIQGHLWYLFAYLYVLLIYLVAWKFNFNKFVDSLIIPLFLLGLAFSENLSRFTDDIFAYTYYRNFFFIGLPYFLVGVFLKKNINKIAGLNKNKLVFILLASNIVQIAIVLVSHFAEMKIAQSDNNLYNIVSSISIFLILVHNDLNSDAEANSKIKNTIAEIGKQYTLTVYIVHMIVLSCLSIVFVDMLGMSAEVFSYFSVFVVFLASMVFSVVWLKIYRFVKCRIKKSN